MFPQQDALKLSWDWGTGYDFFISLHVLNKPNRFALRGAWAKGVRSRLPTHVRTFFEETAGYYLGPALWVHTLPNPKDGKTVLDAYAAIPSDERLFSLMKSPEIPAGITAQLHEIADRGAWTVEDREIIWGMSKEEYAGSPDEINRMLDLWARSKSFGEQSLEAFQAYYDVFFAEEEVRIQPALQHALEQAQEKAEKLPLSDLLIELSEGIHFEEIPAKLELVMVPSFWISPLVTMMPLSREKGIFLFGGRPADASLVPGEVVPDALFRTMKALADPTRMRILRYLAEEPLTPSELAKRLRLRAPTVVHHLNTLRLAGLVYVKFGKSEKDKRYAARLNRLNEMYGQLRTFLEGNRETLSAPREIFEVADRPYTVA